MDPTETYKRVTDDSLPLDERGEAALDLLAWLANHGGIPSPPSGVSIHGYAAQVVDDCKLVLSKVLDIMPGGTARMLGL